MPDHQDIGFGRQLFPALVAQGLPVLGVEVYGYWSDVGTIEDYKRVNFEAIKGLVELDLPGLRTDYGWAGDGSTVASDCRINGTLMLGRNSHVESSVLINGDVIVGDNCHIGTGARLHDCVIWSGTKLGPRAHVFDSIIGENCRIAANRDVVQEVVVDLSLPDQMILPITQFQDAQNAHIGTRQLKAS